jgi:hypothetical protein
MNTRFYERRSEWLIAFVCAILLGGAFAAYMAAGPYRSAVKDSPTTTGLGTGDLPVRKPPVPAVFTIDPVTPGHL